jgi:hypothetical protein
MCNPVLYMCRCGRQSEDVADVVHHIEEIHGSEFNIRSLVVLEDVLSRIISPDPMPAYRKTFVVEGL